MAETETKTDLDNEVIQPFVLRWNKLISTTNWDKGEVICAWRDALKEADAPAADSSDEKWSQVVSGVTPQHVGRLRRTFERFGHVYTEYAGLFWSHFYAALDWDDAEMWLEGAIQNKWSVSVMRNQRWETLGKVDDQPSDDDIVTVESEEELQSLALADKSKDGRGVLEGPRHEGPDFGDDMPSTDGSRRDDDDEDDDDEPKKKKGPKIKPFESFTDLPDDVQAAADAFKVSIIRHRTEEWNEFDKSVMLGLLDALKALVTAE